MNAGGDTQHNVYNQACLTVPQTVVAHLIQVALWSVGAHASGIKGAWRDGWRDTRAVRDRAGKAK